MSDKNVSDFFEKLVEGRDAKLVISWLTVELFSYLKRKNISFSDSKITVEKIGKLLDLISDGTISNRLAKELFDEYISGNKEAKELVNEKGLLQISDKTELISLVRSVIDNNSKMVNEYKSGKDKLFGFFVGQVMKISNGKANPQMVNEILKLELTK